MYFNKEIQGSLICGKCIYKKEEVAKRVKEIEKQISPLADGDRPIGIALNRSVDLICTIIAAIELRIPFVPLDISLPVNRINSMIDSLSVKHVVIEKNSQITESKVNFLYLSHEDNYTCEAEIKENNSDTAYYLFTSGTTGNPKAVQVERVGLNNFIDGVMDIIPFSKNEKVACLTSASFDIFFLEAVLPIYTGLQVVLANDSTIENIRLVCNFIKDEQIDVLQLTPSRLRMIEVVDPELKTLEHVKKILVGGEQFPIDMLQKLQKYTSCRIYNMYGPTETTIWSTISDLTDANEINIGRPIKETQIFILDESGNEIDDEMIGEICIGGKGLARGYHENIEATERAFTYLKAASDIRIYHTGDLGKRSSEGILYCYGRKDSQVKILGHRIELDDIDANLMKLDQLLISVTCFDKELEKLVTYYVAKEKVEKQYIIQEISKLLPVYMVPAVYVEVDSLEYTVSGKVDRRKVEERYRSKLYSHLAPVTESEDEVSSKVIELIQEHLHDRIAVNDKFSQLSIDSLMFVEIITELEELYDFEFDIDMLTIENYETIRDFIDYVKEKVEEQRG